jgi:hypothetical protein
MHARTRPTLYQQLQALPDGLVGEILDGQLHTHPRPTPRHLRAASRLDRIIGRRFDDEEDGRARSDFVGFWWQVKDSRRVDIHSELQEHSLGYQTRSLGDVRRIHRKPAGEVF